MSGPAQTRRPKTWQMHSLTSGGAADVGIDGAVIDRVHETFEAQPLSTDLSHGEEEKLRSVFAG